MLQESLPQNWPELAAAAVEWADKPIEIGDVLYTKMRGSIAKMALTSALQNLLAIQPVSVVAKVELEPMARRKPPQREEVQTVGAVPENASVVASVPVSTKKRQALLDSQAELKTRLTAQPEQEPRRSPRRAKLGDFFSVDEIAQAWGKSRNYVTKIFTSEPGVMVDPNGGKKKKRLERATNDDASEGKRTYTTLIIPESVYFRVCRRLGYNSL